MGGSTDTTGVRDRRFWGTTAPDLSWRPLVDENIARIVIAGVIGGTISISMIAMAVAQLAARRRKSLPEPTVARLEERVARIEEAMDAMATEVERVSDGQRFTSRLLADRHAERT